MYGPACLRNGKIKQGTAEMDWVVGELLKKLDDLGIADNTIVVISTDNGAEVMTWPDGGNTPFHGEKGTTCEGGMRESKMHFRWYADKLWTFVPAQSVVAEWIGTFKEFPPSQPSAIFGPDQALQALSAPGRGN